MNLNELTLKQAYEGLKEKKFSSVEVVKYLLDTDSGELKLV